MAVDFLPQSAQDKLKKFISEGAPGSVPMNREHSTAIFKAPENDSIHYMLGELPRYDILKANPVNIGRNMTLMLSSFTDSYSTGISPRPDPRIRELIWQKRWAIKSYEDGKDYHVSPDYGAFGMETDEKFISNVYPVGDTRKCQFREKLLRAKSLRLSHRTILLNIPFTNTHHFKEHGWCDADEDGKEYKVCRLPTNVFNYESTRDETSNYDRSIYYYTTYLDVVCMYDNLDQFTHAYALALRNAIDEVLRNYYGGDCKAHRAIHIQRMGAKYFSNIQDPRERFRQTMRLFDILVKDVFPKLIEWHGIDIFIWDEFSPYLSEDESANNYYLDKRNKYFWFYNPYQLRTHDKGVSGLIEDLQAIGELTNPININEESLENTAKSISDLSTSLRDSLEQVISNANFYLSYNQGKKS